MNNKGLLVFILLLVSMDSCSQENGENMLKLGYVKVIDYIIGETSQKEYIKYFKIRLAEADFYELEINYNHNNLSEYWNFKMIDIENERNTIRGRLSKISFDDTSGMWFIDDGASGDIIIHPENNLVTVNIIFPATDSASHGNRTQYRIIWENNNKND